MQQSSQKFLRGKACQPPKQQYVFHLLIWGHLCDFRGLPETKLIWLCSRALFEITLSVQVETSVSTSPLLITPINIIESINIQPKHYLIPPFCSRTNAPPIHSARLAMLLLDCLPPIHIGADNRLILEG